MDNTLISIHLITNQINYYGPIIILIFGVPGCICSLITFTAPQLRHNACAFYFLIATIFEFISITFGLLSSFSLTLFGTNAVNTDRIYCKIRAYLVYAIPLIATYMVLLASIDRYLSSSLQVSLRNYSRTKIAYRTTAIAIVIGLVSCLHAMIAYDLRPRCMIMPGRFAMFDSVFVIFWLGVIPHLLMLIFGILTLTNIRRAKRQIYVHPQIHPIIINQRQRREQKTDRQLVAMMLVQAGLSCILVGTFTIVYSYYILKPSIIPNERTIILFIYTVALLFFYTNYAKSFYIYTLSSHLFRSICIYRLKMIFQFAFHRHPLNTRARTGRSTT